MDVPGWLRSFVTSMTDLQFIMEKEITASDVSGDQHRLLIPRRYAQAHLVPLLTAEERRRIFPPGALLPDGRLVRRGNGPGEGQAAGAVGALPVLEGVAVEVYQRSGWKFLAQLKFWPSTGEVVLNGVEYALLKSWNNLLRPGDVVQLWAFRRAGNLCFVIFKV